MVGYVSIAPTQQLMLLVYSQSRVFSGIISRKLAPLAGPAPATSKLTVSHSTNYEAKQILDYQI